MFRSVVCDGTLDCSEGEDEENCPTTSTRPTTSRPVTRPSTAPATTPGSWWMTWWWPQSANTWEKNVGEDGNTLQFVQQVCFDIPDQQHCPFNELSILSSLDHSNHQSHRHSKSYFLRFHCSVVIMSTIELSSKTFVSVFIIVISVITCDVV